MTRDDSSGGWVPMGGGGLSYVSVRKRILPATEDDLKHEYVICGKGINDQVGVLSCTIKKDFEYNKVMPTFHHWRTGDKKYGLTFQTAADARAFDKGVRVAVDELEGSLDIHDADVGDDEVFMAIDLPVERGDSQSSSGSSGGIGVGGSNMVEMLQSPFTHPHANHHYFHRMHYISRSTAPPPPPPTTAARFTPSSNNNNKGGLAVVQDHRHHHQQQQQPPPPWKDSIPVPPPPPPPDVWVKTTSGDPKQRSTNNKDVDKIEIVSEPYSYVQFARDRPSVHEYSYPMVDAMKSGGGSAVDPMAKKLSTVTSQQQQVQPTALLPIKSKWTTRHKKRDKLKHLLLDRSRCKHCHEMFDEDENERGSCEYAPDAVRSCIGAVTCLSCAQCMLYHCMSDAEGDFAQHPCSCDRADGHCTRRWFGLAILSIFVPCLWCYLPMSTCHRCGIGYGVCGARHEAS